MALARGNAAKLYCLQRLQELARDCQRFRIVDLGAGAAANFVPLLRSLPHVEYVAVEPSAGECERARRNLEGLNAQVVCALAYDADLGPADAVVSFSVLEHVYDRPAYLRAVARNLAPGGHALMNYDSGHFTHPTLRDRVKTLAGPWLARAGREQWYQSFVRESELRSLVAGADLAVAEAKSFNTALKFVYRRVPEESRDEFTRLWLDFELRLNDLLEPYEDEHATDFMTRNFVLRHASAEKPPT